MTRDLFEQDMEDDSLRHGEALPGARSPQAPGMQASPVPKDSPRIEALRTAFPIKGVLKPHQAVALDEAGGKDGHALFIDPGGGKTLTCIAEASKLWAEGQIDGVLIIAPNRPHMQWVDEQFPLWADVPVHTNHNREPPGRMRKWFDKAGSRAMGVLAINFESVITPKGRELMDRFYEKYPRVYLINDESQKTKSPTAQRTKAVMIQALRSERRRILSGTPLLNGLEDMWSQYEIAKPGLGWPHEPIRMLPRNKVSTHGYLGFKAHYCVTRPIRGTRQEMIVGYRNQGHLHARVQPYVTRILSEDFSKMPKPDIIRRPVEMNPAQRAKYNSMQDELLAQIEGETITADNALVQMGKLLQIANGFLYRADRETDGWEPLSTTKVDDTCDLIELLEERVIVWSPYIAQQQMFLIEAMDRNERKLWRPRNIYNVDQLEQWKNDPLGVLFGNQGSGLGVGLNLQMCAANIYMANTFNAEHRWQSIARTDRIGQQHQVRVWDQITDGTLEVGVVDALLRKERLAVENIDVLRSLL